MSFQIHALPHKQFEPLFAMSDDELVNARAVRKIADAGFGYPCRISLVDADIGETIILVNYEHQSAQSPFKAAHAIFVRENAEQMFPDVGTVPKLFETRMISIRGFDDKHFIVNAALVEGSCLSESIPTILRDKRVAYLHLHNAKLGCYIARVTRA